MTDLNALSTCYAQADDNSSYQVIALNLSLTLSLPCTPDISGGWK